MKKKVLSIYLLVAIFALAGCNSNSTSASNKPSVSAPDSVSPSIPASPSVSIEPSVSAQPSTSSSASNSSALEKKEITSKEVANIISKGLEAQSKVKSGSLVTAYSTATYEYGTDKYGDFTFVSSYENTYFGHDSTNAVYGITINSNGTLSSAYNPSEENLYGPSFFTYSKNLYGVKGLMSYVLEIITQNANKDFEGLSLSSDSNVKFKVGLVGKDYADNPTLTIAEIEFQTNQDAFTSIKFSSSTYDNKSITANYENGTYSVNEGATTTNTNSISYVQNVGERTLQNPYDIETMYFESINFVDNENNTMTDEYSFPSGSSLTFKLGTYAPSTANSGIDQIKVTLPDGVTGLSGFFSNNILTISSFQEGDYVATIKTAKTSKTVTFHVTKAVPTSMYLSAYTLEGSTYSLKSLTENPSLDLYVNQPIYLKANMNPYTASQEFSAEIIEGDASKSSLEVANISVYGSDVKTYSFSANEVGTYKVKMFSSVSSNVSQNITINVKAAPSFDSLISKKYIRSSKGVNGVEVIAEVTFAPDVSNNKVGNVTIVDNTLSTNMTLKYAYNESTKTFVLSQSDDTPVTNVGLSISASYNLILTTDTGTSTYSLQLEAFSLESFMKQTNWAGTTTNKVMVGLFFKNEENKVQFSITKYDENYVAIINVRVDADVTISETDDGYEVVLDSASLAQIVANEHVDSIDKIVIAKDYKGINVTLSVDGVIETVKLTFARG